MSQKYDKQLLTFLVIAIVVASGTWVQAMVWRGLPKTLPLVGLFAPALAAALVGGRGGLRDLLARAGRWRFPAVWYVVAALLMPVCYAIAIRVEGAVFHRDLSQIWIGSSPAFLFVSFMWLVVVTSGEEIGWRGFLLPRLFHRGWSPWSASLAIGIVWGLWHLPLYLMPGQSPMPYTLFLALIAGQSLIYTALCLRSGGSLLPAMLLHASTDFGARLYHLDRFDRGTWALVDVLVVSAGAVMLYSVSRPSTSHSRSAREP